MSNDEIRMTNGPLRCQAVSVVIWLFFILHPSSFILSSPPPRYTAIWDDGTRADADDLGPWNDTAANPRLGGRPLFAPPAVCWMVDNTLEPAAAATARVELIGGDLLPGRVIGVRSGGDTPSQALPMHLLVAPSPQLDKPASPSRAAIRVPARWVQRIVWKPVAQAYRPGVLFARDGRQIAFRAVRFGVRLLVESGVEEVPLGEIAELHLPATDVWEAYLEQLAALTPGPAGRLIRWETADGLRVTGSTARFQAACQGLATDNPNRWYHMLQPAWSLDPLWVPFRKIRLRVYVPWGQTPLAWFAPVEVRQQSTFGSSWRWRLDRNVEGGPLTSGGRLFAWGFGVHALAELQFALPSYAVAMRTRLGLDAAAGDGGCVQASVSIQPGAKKLFESPILVGSRQTLDTGRLAFGEPASGRRLVLLVDPAHAGRPAGADPFDIRDHFDWLEPVVELDAQRLAAEAFQRAGRLVPAWSGWDVQTAGRSGALLVNHWFDRPTDRAGFRLLAATADGPLVLTRNVQVGPPSDLLQISVSRPEESPPSRIEVRADGRMAAELEVPPTQFGRQTKPLEVSLADFHGQRLRLEIAQRGAAPQALVEWQQIELGARNRP
jgi:hypothetical protein